MNRDTTKEYVYIALESFKNYIHDMSPEDFEIFMSGRSIFGAMLPPKYFSTPINLDQDYLKVITRLEFRIS